MHPIGSAENDHKLGFVKKNLLLSEFFNFFCSLQSSLNNEKSVILAALYSYV